MLNVVKERADPSERLETHPIYNLHKCSFVPTSCSVPVKHNLQNISVSLGNGLIRLFRFQSRHGALEYKCRRAIRRWWRFPSAGDWAINRLMSRIMILLLRYFISILTFFFFSLFLFFLWIWMLHHLGVSLFFFFFFFFVIHLFFFFFPHLFIYLCECSEV